ncbi:hypothetical protein [Sulfurospirillum sp. 1612]|uniref:hypothetical protein n=1 Tax=Sulfurospirillum sp. 1612 TaxID=3094835 RepID=UPI002F928D4D
MAECICKLKKNKFNNLFDSSDEFDKFAENVPNFSSFITIEDNNLTNFKVSPDYIPAYDEWFYLETDDLENNVKRHIDKIYEHFRSSTDLSNIDSLTLNDIKLVMYGEEVDSKLKINFQVITSKKYIAEDKKFLFFDNGTKLLENNNLLQFEDKVDFILCEDTGRIYFKQLSHLNNIHGDFKHLYKEASKSDVNNIFNTELVNLVDINSDLINSNKISSINLKKISFYKTNGTFEKIKNNPNEFLIYMNKFDVLKELVSDEKISIQSDNNMKIFMKACSEQVYQGDFTGDSFMANANKKI